MARKTNIMIQLEQTLTAMDIDPQTLIAHTRNLLAAYSKLAWLGNINPQPHTPIAQIRAGLDLIQTLSAGNLAPTPQIGHGSGIVCDIMQQTLAQIQAYPANGQQYHTILQHAYFDPDPLTDAILMEQLHLERTTYYSRKREAVTLYGYLIYTKYLPQLHQASR